MCGSCGHWVTCICTFSTRASDPPAWAFKERMLALPRRKCGTLWSCLAANAGLSEWGEVR